MNRYCLAFACALTLLLTAPAYAGTALPLEKAFLGLPWGTDIREHDGFKFLHGKEGLRFYAKPGVVRMANGIRVEQVIYGTYNYNFFFRLSGAGHPGIVCRTAQLHGIALRLSQDFLSSP